MPGIETPIRELAVADLKEVVRIDALRTGKPKPAYWKKVLAGRAGWVGIAAAGRGEPLSGYLIGEVRAFEFGSEPCGWIFAVAVDPASAREGVATALLDEACRRFRAAGVERIRTMVRRTDVPFLSFFRARGFVGGPFVQLERELEIRP